MTDAPAAVIQSDHGCINQVRIEPCRPGDAAREDDWTLTKRDHGNIAVMRNRLGDQVNRISIVEQFGTRADFFHVGDDVLHDADRT